MIILIFRTKAPNGYNLTDGGDGRSGCLHTEKSKELIRLKAIGRTHTQETKDKLRISSTGNQNALGHMPNEVAREKMSLANIGSVHTPEHIAKVKEAITGLKRTEETRYQISESKMGNDYGKYTAGIKRSDQAIENMKQASQLRYSDKSKPRANGERSPESKERMRQAALNRKRVYTEEERIEIGKKTREAWAKRSEEQRKAIAEKISAANTGVEFSQTTRERMSEARKQWQYTDEQKAAISERGKEAWTNRTNRNHSPETIAKISATKKSAALKRKSETTE